MKIDHCHCFYHFSLFTLFSCMLQILPLSALWLNCIGVSQALLHAYVEYLNRKTSSIGSFICDFLKLKLRVA